MTRKEISEFLREHSEWNPLWGQIYCYCANCGKSLRTGEAKYPSKNHVGVICQQCSERENMPNIKITAEVDGKQVPLETVSTETFEAIKALEKPKEIPVARIGNYVNKSSKRRLFLKTNEQFKRTIVEGEPYMIAVDLDSGSIAAYWDNEKGVYLFSAQYENVKPL